MATSALLVDAELDTADFSSGFQYDIPVWRISQIFVQQFNYNFYKHLTFGSTIWNPLHL